MSIFVNIVQYTPIKWVIIGGKGFTFKGVSDHKVRQGPITTFRLLELWLTDQKICPSLYNFHKLFGPLILIFCWSHFLQNVLQFFVLFELEFLFLYPSSVFTKNHNNESYALKVTYEVWVMSKVSSLMEAARICFKLLVSYFSKEMRWLEYVLNF